jgi:hypothetical protein
LAYQFRDPISATKDSAACLLVQVVGIGVLGKFLPYLCTFLFFFPHEVSESDLPFDIN